MQLIKKYDPKTEAEWFEYEDAKFLIAPMHNPTQKNYARETLTLSEAIAVDEQGIEGLGNLKANDAIKKYYQIWANGLVFDWEGVNDENGKEVKFSHENMHTLMCSNIPLTNWVGSKANELLIKKIKEQEEVVKN